MAVHRRIETSQANTDGGEVTIVQFVDRKILEPAQIEELGEELFALVDAEGCKHVLLNFQHVEFLSSAALNKLINLHHKVANVGGKLKLSNLRREISEVFDITKLTRLFDIQKSEADALSSF